MKAPYYLLFFLIGFSTIITQAQINCSFTLSTKKGCSPVLIEATASETSAYPIAQRKWNVRNANGTFNQTTPTGVNQIFQYIAVSDTCDYFIVTLWSENTNGDTCRISDTVLVYPKVDIQPEVVLQDCSVDSPTVVLYPNFSACGGSIDSVGIYWGDGSKEVYSSPSPLDSSIHTYNATQGCFDISIIAYSSLGCGGDTTIYDAVCIGVMPKAKGYVSNDTLTCYPASIYCYDTSTVVGSNRVWLFDDDTWSFSSNPQHMYYAPGSYVVKLVRCMGNCCDTLIVDTVVVSGPSLASYTYSANAFCACADTILVTLNTVNTASVQLVNPCYAPGTSPVVNLNTIGTDSIPTAIAFDFYSCKVGNCIPKVKLQSPDGCLVNQYLNSVFPDTPVVNFQFDRANACIDGNFCFLSSVSYALNIDSTIMWHWNFGDGTTASVAHPCHYFMQQGSFNVTLTVTSKNGCTRTITKQVNNHFSLNPEADFSLSYNSPNKIDFQNQSTNATSSQWHFGDGTVSSAWSPSKVFISTGNFEVELVVSDSLGCTDTTSQYVSIVMAVHETPSNFHLKASPNPFSEYTSVSIPEVDSDYELKLFNFFGQQMFAAHGKAAVPVTLYKGNLPAGVYLLELSIAGNTLAKGKVLIVD